MGNTFCVDVGVSATSMLDEMSLDTLHFFDAIVVNPLIFRAVGDTSGDPPVRSMMEEGDPPR
jgi:hypothetical protein